MARADEDDLDSLVLIGLGIAAFYILTAAIRAQQSTDRGGPIFQPANPAGPGGGGGTSVQRGVDVLAPMRLSDNGEAFIKREEGLVLTLGRDVGKPVIGWGHDIVPGDRITQQVTGTVYPRTITRAQAQQIFDLDMSDTASVLNRAITVEVSQNQFDALSSLEFNIGAGAFRGSTVLRRLNAHDYNGAAQAFALFNKSGGAINRTLVGRRGRESNLFNGAGA